MAGVFSGVLTTSLYATVVGLVIILFKEILKNKLNAEWHFLIWSVLILKLLIPFGPESVVSLFNAMPERPQQSMTELAYQMEKQYEATLITENSVQYVPPAQQQVKVLKLIAFGETLLPYVWAIGAALMLLWLIITYCSLHRRLRRRSFAADKGILGIFSDCKAKMGIGRNISLVVQDVIGTPSLFGIIRPKILLYPGVVNLSDKELEYVLLHELAHYQRKDVLTNYLLLVFQIMHWFNPVMWYCFKRIRQDMEIATDQRVLSVLKSTEHKDYGRALLTVLESFTASKLAPKLLGMVDDKKNIKRRLQMIKTAEFFQSKRRFVLVIGLLCVGVLGGVLLTNGVTKNSSSPNPTMDKQDLSFRLLVYPEQYTPAVMSSRPLGIRISADYNGSVGKVRYATENGSFVTLDVPSVGLPTIELPYDIPVYWVPSGQNKKNVITVTLVDEKGSKIDEKQVTIIYDGSLTYTVKSGVGIIFSLTPTQSQPYKSKNINEAISQAIITYSHKYLVGETTTEGHFILDTVEKNGTVKVFSITSTGAFGFENGIFTKVSGSGAVPTVMSFTKDEIGEYSLLEYQEPEDGAGYTDSLKKMFPISLMAKVTDADKYYSDLIKQQEVQAEEYLQRIGRTAKVNSAPVEKKLAEINTDASNLFIEIAKDNSLLSNCLKSLGTRERIENGTRYIYETSQSKTSDGHDLIVFRKAKEDGTIVEEYQYKIVGNQPQLIRSLQ
jgi:beta-lactamase regulating signal transducer with metallopeptidase domain